MRKQGFKGTLLKPSFEGGPGTVESADRPGRGLPHTDKLMWADVQFNTLLFLTDKRSPNVRKKGMGLRRLYARQALGLARSLNICGKNLRVFTNDRKGVITLMRDVLVDGGGLPEIREITFPEWPLPENVRFFAAHHKIFLFEQFARESFPNCLLDVDVVINYRNLSMSRLFDQKSHVDGWVYDISDQVFPAYGTEVVQNDIRLLGVDHPFPRWYGGEFILAKPHVFSYIFDECLREVPFYISALPRLHHVGDECLVSAALNRNSQNLVLADAGASGIVVRQWTMPTQHVGRSPRVLNQSLFWHLPDGKHTLGRFYRHGNFQLLYRSIRYLAAQRRLTAVPRSIIRNLIRNAALRNVDGQ